MDKRLEEVIKRLPNTLKSILCRLNVLEDNSATAINDDVSDPFTSGSVNYNAENYNSLLTLAPNPNDYDFAWVREAQGTKYLPFSWGGTYYDKGMYMYNGVIWESSTENINKAINDLNKEHQVEFITADTILPNSATFEGTIIIKNVHATITYNINTITADKLEGLDIQPIGPGDSFSIKKYLLNDYRIV